MLSNSFLLFIFKGLVIYESLHSHLAFKCYFNKLLTVLAFCFLGQGLITSLVAPAYNLRKPKHEDHMFKAKTWVTEWRLVKNNLEYSSVV